MDGVLVVCCSRPRRRRRHNHHHHHRRRPLTLGTAEHNVFALNFIVF